MRIGNFGQWEGDNPGGHHPPNCTCVQCNERRLQREAAGEEERRAREYDRRVAQSRSGGQRRRSSGRQRPPLRSPRAARPRRRGPSLRLLLIPLTIVAGLAGVFLYVTSNDLFAPQRGGEPSAVVAIVPTEEPTESAHTPPTRGRPAQTAVATIPGPTPLRARSFPAPTPVGLEIAIPTPLARTETVTGPRLGTIPAVPVAAPTPVSAPTSSPAPHLRHIDEKLYMLELINEERSRAGVPAVELGDNQAAQLHAEASLEGCYSSHWGTTD